MHWKSSLKQIKSVNKSILFVKNTFLGSHRCFVRTWKLYLFSNKWKRSSGIVPSAVIGCNNAIISYNNKRFHWATRNKTTTIVMGVITTGTLTPTNITIDNTPLFWHIKRSAELRTNTKNAIRVFSDPWCWGYRGLLLTQRTSWSILYDQWPLRSPDKTNNVTAPLPVISIMSQVSACHQDDSSYV